MYVTEIFKGLAKIVEAFDWSEFVVLYEDDQGLLRLQEVLKIHQFEEENLKNAMTLEKLDIGGDNRYWTKLKRGLIGSLHLENLDSFQIFAWCGV